MDINQFTVKGQEAIAKAVSLASANGQQAVEEPHLLLGVLSDAEGLAPRAIQKAGFNLAVIRSTAEAMVASRPKTSGGEPYLSTEARAVLERAAAMAKKGGDAYASVEHILLAVAEGDAEAAKMLRGAGVTAKALRKAVDELRKGARVESPDDAPQPEALPRFAVNLNQLAAAGKLDPVIGREEEIRRLLQILSRRTKNNPVIIGEPGVGKTAIIEGLAQRIVKGDVPENLRSKTVYSLDMGALVAGAKYKGEFEERLKAVVREVTDAKGEIVLFIDEIHTLVGAGKGDGAMDAANILKPALARGELRAIGATTLDEYRKYFEKDKALERRFQVVMADEPDAESTVAILRGLKERYEAHHQVRIKDEALIAAVELSVRYIGDRFLPDKAIDLVDEAAAKLRVEINSVPEEVDVLQRQIMQLEIERAALDREPDSGHRGEIERRLADARAQLDQSSGRWRAERAVIDDLQAEKRRIDDLKFESEKAEREGDYGRVAEIRYGRLKESGDRVAALERRLADAQAGDPMVKEEVDAEDIAEVVSRWTGVPVAKMLGAERDKLLGLDDALARRVVGQPKAIAAVADAVRRSRAGLHDARRPIGSFIFLGSSGVGKTELAKALAEQLFDDEGQMTRVDMSEYQERHSVSRLIGAPPGYVGYDEGGLLTEAVRRKPYSVVLLDEIEKAHPDVFNILLQVLDDGRLTDNKGRVADFRNTIVIMTSNLGAGDRDTEPQLLLRRAMPPEFVNRVDEIIRFEPLSPDVVRQVVRIQFGALAARLGKEGVRLSITDQAVEHLARASYDPVFGARPVKRNLQRMVMNELARGLISGSVPRDARITVDAGPDGIVFR